jgi:tetratricopeptide (TPR) repeat protein
MLSAKAAGDVGAEAEAEAFSGDIAFQKGRMDEGKTLTAHALELSRKPGVAPSVRVWSEIYYAANREEERLPHRRQSAHAAARGKELAHDDTVAGARNGLRAYQLAEDYEVRGRLDEAAQLIQQDIDIYNSEPYAVCDQSQMYEDLAYIDVSRGDIQDSLPLFSLLMMGSRPAPVRTRRTR